MPRGPKPLKTKLRKNEFYCVACRKRVRVAADDVDEVTVYNKRVHHRIPMEKSSCPKCDVTVNKFVKW